MSTASLTHSLRTAESSNAMQSHLKYRRDIDGLRAVAVLAVLVFHAFPKSLTGGFVGVDIFFVISGFLITKVIVSALEDGTFSIVDFYVRRVRRIFPALSVVLIACLAFGWKSMLAEDLAQLAKHVLGGATFSSNLLLWREAGYFDAVSESKPLLHLWSLGIEEQFYIVWPVLMWWGWRRGVSPALLIGVTALVSFGINVVGITKHQTATFYSPLSRAWELLMGAGLAHLRTSGGAPSRTFGRHAASIVGAVLIVYAAVALDAGRKFPGWWALLPSIGACLIIWAGPAAWVNRTILAQRAMVAIGLISFPLYLWHWPLLILGRDVVASGALGRFELLVASAIAAWGTYVFVERPFRYGGRARSKVLWLCLLMVLIASVAAAILKMAGVPSRYPQIIQNATKADFRSFLDGMRYKTCFLDFDQTRPEYAAECVDPGTKPLMMVWGDSGAAAMFPGFRALANKSGKFRLAQFTSSACPPLLDFVNSGRPYCAQNNQEAFKRAQELKPDVVVLNAIWQYYAHDQLKATIVRLREIGVGHVIVVGPGITWKEPPGRVVLKLWQDDPLHRLPSTRLDYGKFGAVDGIAALETSLRDTAEKNGADYLSVLDVLCEGSSCLMRASSKSGDSFFLDTAHLNPIGAEFVVSSLSPKLTARLTGSAPR